MKKIISGSIFRRVQSTPKSNRSTSRLTGISYENYQSAITSPPTNTERTRPRRQPTAQQQQQQHAVVHFHPNNNNNDDVPEILIVGRNDMEMSLRNSM